MKKGSSRRQAQIGPSTRGTTRRIEGRRHSRIEITSGPVKTLFKLLGRKDSKGKLRIGSEFAERVTAMQKVAGAVLRRRALPDVPIVYVTRTSPSRWQSHRPAASDFKSSSTIELYVRQRGVDRDSPEDLAARILTTIAFMEANPALATGLAFELGRLWTLLRVYATESAPGVKGGALGALSKRREAEAWQERIASKVERFIAAGKSNSNVGALLAPTASRAPRTVAAYAAKVRKTWAKKSAK